MLATLPATTSVLASKEAERVRPYLLCMAPSQSQWPCGLWCGSAAARLLGLWVRFPPGGMNVCLLWVLCFVRNRSLATGRSLVQRSPTEYSVSECDRDTSTARRPWPTGGFGPQRKKVYDVSV
jgi:hypothetical protein